MSKNQYAIRRGAGRWSGATAADLGATTLLLSEPTDNATLGWVADVRQCRKHSGDPWCRAL